MQGRALYHSKADLLKLLDLVDESNSFGIVWREHLLRAIATDDKSEYQYWVEDLTQQIKDECLMVDQVSGQPDLEEILALGHLQATGSSALQSMQLNFNPVSDITTDQANATKVGAMLAVALFEALDFECVPLTSKSGDKAILTGYAIYCPNYIGKRKRGKGSK
jgi:hypothetical protein